MARQKHKSLYSKVSVKSQTVLPREIRERLRIGPGDRIRYVINGDTVSIEKGNLAGEDDPFIAFTEWASDEDDKAFAKL